MMPRWPYRTLGTLLDRIYRNDLNSNFTDIASDMGEQKARVDNLITATPQPSEVVDARTDTDGTVFTVLKDRLDSDSNKIGDLSTLNTSDKTSLVNAVNNNVAQLADIATEYLSDYPRISGETDDTGRIQRAISSASTNGGGIIYLGFGSYTASTLTMKSNVWLMGQGATLTFNSASTGNLLFFDNITNVRLNGLILEGSDRTAYSVGATQGNRVGMYFNDVTRIVIEDCTVNGFTSAGAYLTALGSRSDSYSSRAVKFKDIDFYNNYYGLMFDTTAEYCQVITCNAYQNYIGISVGSGNVHISDSYFNQNIDGIHVISGTNDSHGSFVGCFSNHNSQYSLYVDGIANGEIFNGCAFYYADIYLKNATGVQITNSHIGGNGNIYLEGGGWNAIKDNFFNPMPTFHRGYNSTTDKTEVKNNRCVDGTSPFLANTPDYFVDLRSISPVATTITARTVLVYTTGSGSMYNQGQSGASLYNGSTGRGNTPLRRTYSFNYSFKLSNLDTVNNQRVLVGIQVYMPDGTTTVDLMGYQYINVPAGKTSHVVNGTWTQLFEAGYQYELFIIPENTSLGVQITSNSEARFYIQSLD